MSSSGEKEHFRGGNKRSFNEDEAIKHKEAYFAVLGWTDYIFLGLFKSVVRVKRLPLFRQKAARWWCKRGKINFDIYEVIPASYWAIMSNIKVIFTLCYVAIFPVA